MTAAAATAIVIAASEVKFAIGTGISRVKRIVIKVNAARVAAAISLLCWTVALVCGRFLAYV